MPSAPWRHQFAGDPAKGLDVDVEGAHSEGQQINQLLLAPALHVQPVVVTSQQVLGHPRRDQHRPPPIRGRRLGHRPHSAHELGQLLAV